MSSGYYLLHRGWMDHPSLSPGEPFCRRAAWVWLIENAAWRDTKIDINGKTITVKRGQISVSYRRLAEIWGWGLEAVRQFLTRLKRDTAINTENNTGRMLITLCNYDQYQAPIIARNTGENTLDNTATTQQQHSSNTQKKEVKKGKKRRRDSSSPMSDENSPSLFPSASVRSLPGTAEVIKEAVDLWNAVASSTGLPTITKLTIHRRRSLQARLDDAGGIEGWRLAMRLVETSDYLHGGSDGTWRADFDFVVRPERFDKLMNGGYNRQSRVQGPRSARAALRTDDIHPMFQADGGVDEPPNPFTIDGKWEIQ